MKPIKRGDYFLMPYNGPRRENLSRVVRCFGSQCEVTYPGVPGLGSSLATLAGSAARRCSPSLARRILGRSNTKPSDA